MHIGGEEELWNDEMTDSVDRYEKMILNQDEWYFDVHELENIIDYYFNQKKFQSARDALKLALRLHPDSPALKLKESQLHIERGEAKKALAIIELLEPIDSFNDQLYIIKGSAFLLLDNISKAQESYQKALDASEDPDEWVLNIVYAFVKLGEFETAITFLKQALAKDPNSEDLLWELAVCYEQAGQEEKAIESYKTCIENDPFSDASWFNLGVLYNQAEQFEASVEAFDYVLAISPDFQAALFNKGNALANNNLHEEAIKVYAEYLIDNDNHAQTHFYIGESYEKLNKATLALQYFRKARSIDPNYSEPWFGMASIMHTQGNDYEAMYYIRKAISLKKGNPDYLFLAGEVYISLEFYEDAHEVFKQVLKLDPDDSEAKKHIETIKSKLDEPE
ncbi:MAG: tetratricopeptide repeat protein [Bacteroidetes bacterium]|jgi:tetratricopeptide (TPR) repeat protein|nr:tetratricopeptide repeat protein [Bacteroidota bacterium]MBT3750953.1 tetratricopeptide repeat protein [Bacteroidota bacterium]MBT4400309.1 tetratricopeptide repeat protein [Bacteroidota bacterium]MBT4410817.1 tetratricopeptide repeat protein [Bacteroidota bacterium]MBT7092493.1 tetratricopeptide repeat protein [Bacteroidota bacterium]